MFFLITNKLKNISRNSYWQNRVINSLLPDFLLVLILLINLIGSLIVLFKYDFPLGVDGFYYTVQITAFLEKGSFYYPTSTPVVLYLAVSLCKLGVEPVSAMKILSSLLYLVLILAVYLNIREATENKWTGLAGACIIAASVLRWSWIIEFVSNLGGIAFLLCGIYCLVKKSHNKVWLVPGVIFLIAAFFSHKSILPLFFLIFLSYAAFYVLAKSIGSRLFPVFLFFLISIGFLYPLIFTIYPFNSFFPTISENVSFNPNSPLFIKGYFEEKFILLILSPVSFFISLWNWKLSKNLALSNGQISILAIFVMFNPFLTHTEIIITIADRLLLLMHVQIAFLFAFTTHLIAVDKKSKILITASILVLLLLGNGNEIKGNDKRFLTQRQNLIINLEKFKETIPKQSVIIAPHGYQFLITSVLEIPSQRLLSNERYPVYWLIFGVPCDKADKKSTIVSIEGRLCTVIVENGNIKPVSIQDREFLFNINPHLKRLNEEQKERLIPLEANE